MVNWGWFLEVRGNDGPIKGPGLKKKEKKLEVSDVIGEQFRLSA